MVQKGHNNQLQPDHHKQNGVQHFVDQLPDAAEKLVGRMPFIEAFVANDQSGRHRRQWNGRMHPVCNHRYAQNQGNGN